MVFVTLCWDLVGYLLGVYWVFVGCLPMKIPTKPQQIPNKVATSTL